MSGAERSPAYGEKKETVLEKAGNVVLKIIGVAILAGIAYIGIKASLPVMKKYAAELKEFIG